MINGRRHIWTGFRITVTILSLYFLYTQVQESQISLSQFEIPANFLLVLLLQVSLMVINWMLEIYRWKISIEPVEKIKFKVAAFDVLGGLAMNWLLPFTTGDFISRIVSKKDKYRATSAVVLNRVIMLLITIIVGVIGVIELIELIELNLSFWYIIFGVFLLLLIPLLVRFRLLRKFINYFIELDRSVFLQILAISICRYAVFFIQFLILIKFFNPELRMFEVAAGIGWIFLIRTSIPSMFGGVGLREASALVFFDGMVTNINLIIFPVFVLWLLNTVVPSMLGAFLLWKIKPQIS